MSWSGIKSRYQHILDCRFRVAKEISIAVLSVHAADYVHKNIRPDSIVLFSKANSTLANEKASPDCKNLSSAFLTERKMLREASHLSNCSGNVDWVKSFYRHEDR